MKITYERSMDLAHRQYIAPLYAVRGDQNSRELRISLWENGVPFEIASNVDFTVKYETPNGYCGDYNLIANGDNAVTAENNILTVLLASQLFLEDGTGYFVLTIRKNDEEISTFNIPYIVEKIPTISDDVETINISENGIHDVSLYQKANVQVFSGLSKTVKEYGAKGDGVTDDTQAIQDALAKNRVVSIPEGIYKISDSLLIRENCGLILTQATVLNFQQLTKNCIEMQRSAYIQGNHATVFVPYTFTANVIHASTDVEDGDSTDVPPWTAWDPQFKMTRYVTDLNICKPNSWGGRCNSLDGAVYGTAVNIYCERQTASDYGNGLEQSFMWGVTMSGLRIAGGFVNGIHIHNDGTAWNHEMRIEALIEGCETGVLVENCHNVHLAVTIQPKLAEQLVNGSVVTKKFAKHGFKLVDSNSADLSQSCVWDWNDTNTLWAADNEYQHIAMYGNCYGMILGDFRYYADSMDIRDTIYTDTASNLEKITILQEPFTRWFKPQNGAPYFSDGTTEKPLMLREEMGEYFNTERIQGYTDALANAIDTDGSIYNGIGYNKTGGRINGSTGLVSASDSVPYYGHTGFIACKSGQTLYAQGMTLDEDGWSTLVFYNSSFVRIASANLAWVRNNNSTNSPYTQYAEIENGFTIAISGLTNLAYIRIGMGADGFGTNPIISVGHPIAFTQEGYLADGIKVRAEQTDFVIEAGGEYVDVPQFTDVKSPYQDGAYDTGGTISTRAAHLYINPKAFSVNDVVRIRGLNFANSSGACRIYCYKKDGSYLEFYNMQSLINSATSGTGGGGVFSYSWDAKTYTLTVTFNGQWASTAVGAYNYSFGAPYASGYDVNSVVMTLNEEIIYETVWEGEPRRFEEDIHAQNVMLTSPSGKKFRLTISDSGVLTSAEI